jgi:hypothetical protein
MSNMNIKYYYAIFTITFSALPYLSAQSLIDVTKVDAEDMVISEGVQKDIERAITDVANDANYQILRECAQLAENNKTIKDLFEGMLLKRVDELVGYRDSFLRNHYGKVSLLALSSSIMTVYYLWKINYTTYKDSLFTHPFLDDNSDAADAVYGKKMNDLGWWYKVTFLSFLATFCFLDVKSHGEQLHQSYIDMQGDLQIERLNDLLSSIRSA